MSDSVFLPDDFTENLEIEAKLAKGRDGRGELPKSFWETYSAFANSQGGTVFLGLEETEPGRFRPVGIIDVERVETDLWNQLNNPQKVSHNLLLAHHIRRIPLTEGRHLLSVEVPRASRAQRPVFIGPDVFSGTYKRNRSGDYRCGRSEIERMLAERIEDSRDTRILPHFNFDDLCEATVSVYRQRFAGFKPDHPYNSLNARDFLRSIGAWNRSRETREEGLTVAGLLMFGDEHAIRESFPHLFLDYRELPVSGSKTEWVDRLIPDGTWSGNLFDFYRLVINRLFRDLKVPLAFSGDQREDDSPLHRALREAMVNTLVHADYSERTSTLVVKAPDYFGFRNPGHMRISIDDALAGGKSDCRNRTLQRMFSLIGLGEQAGSGIPRILKHWNDLAYRRPELWEDATPPATLMRLRTVSLMPKETITSLRARFGDRFDPLPEVEKMALATAQVEGFVSNRRFQQMSREHPSEITKILRRLVDERFLVADRAGRATTYRIFGSESPDLGASFGSEANHPGGTANPSSPHKIGSSPHKDSSSPHKTDSSPHKDDSSPHKDGSSPHNIPARLVGEDGQVWSSLLAMTATIRQQKRRNSEMTSQTILRVCEGRFLAPDQLSKLLGLSIKNLRDRFLTPMQRQGLLERRFPHTPNHENQAYRTAPSTQATSEIPT